MILIVAAPMAGNLTVLLAGFTIASQHVID
jgi:hypothetical protein